MAGSKQIIVCGSIIQILEIKKETEYRTFDVNPDKQQNTILGTNYSRWYTFLYVAPKYNYSFFQVFNQELLGPWYNKDKNIFLFALYY